MPSQECWCSDNTASQRLHDSQWIHSQTANTQMLIHILSAHSKRMQNTLQECKWARRTDRQERFMVRPAAPGECASSFPALLHSARFQTCPIHPERQRASDHIWVYMRLYRRCLRHDCLPLLLYSFFWGISVWILHVTSLWICHSLYPSLSLFLFALFLLQTQGRPAKKTNKKKNILHISHYPIIAL